MLRAGRIDAATLRIRFRAPLHSDLLERLAAQTGTSSLIEILPAVPYREALREMMRSDSLLVMQGANCNDQIPAKLYEYFRAGRPILGLADPTGDTGLCMLRAGVRQVVPLEDTARGRGRTGSTHCGSSVQGVCRLLIGAHRDHVAASAHPSARDLAGRCLQIAVEER